MISRRLLAAAAGVGLAASFVSVVAADVVQKDGLRVKFDGELSPNRLPRVGVAPVAVSLSGDISTSDDSAPPQLRTIRIALNRYGRLRTASLPRCRYHQIQPASTTEAVAACRDSLVGTGSFAADVALPDQSPFPSDGTVLAFNGQLHGKPVIYAHIYGTDPIPISQLVVFRIHRVAGTFRVVLSAELPQVAAEWGYVNSLSLRLHRTYRVRGRLRSYISAGCPAPKGFQGAVFPFARAAFGFEDGHQLDSTLIGNCRVRS